MKPNTWVLSHWGQNVVDKNSCPAAFPHLSHSCTISLWRWSTSGLIEYAIFLPFLNDGLQAFILAEMITFSLFWIALIKLKLSHTKYEAVEVNVASVKNKAEIKRSHHWCPRQSRKVRTFACRCRWRCCRMDSDALCLGRIPDRMG